ncbi:Tektin-4 [Galemys pyrenaicus]|uniref:Tektin-4 n=1 Tax=Galemys pyrenaicus TaxID=202257 RepID=A0A8J5ZKE7_GALPY|nr:Tektin-4 [Galemys pyrenaicus]
MCWAAAGWTPGGPEGLLSTKEMAGRLLCLAGRHAGPTTSTGGQTPAGQGAPAHGRPLPAARPSVRPMRAPSEALRHPCSSKVGRTEPLGPPRASPRLWRPPGNLATRPTGRPGPGPVGLGKSSAPSSAPGPGAELRLTSRPSGEAEARTALPPTPGPRPQLRPRVISASKSALASPVRLPHSWGSTVLLKSSWGSGGARTAQAPIALEAPGAGRWRQAIAARSPTEPRPAARRPRGQALGRAGAMACCGDQVAGASQLTAPGDPPLCLPAPSPCPAGAMAPTDVLLTRAPAPQAVPAHQLPPKLYEVARNTGAHTSAGLATAGFRTAKYLLDEWFQGCYARYHQALADRDGSEHLRHESGQLAAQTEARARRTQADSTRWTGARLQDTQAWQAELQRQADELAAETELLLASRRRLQRALDAVALPLSIATDNLQSRERRQHPDLVQDGVELGLLQVLGLPRPWPHGSSLLGPGTCGCPPCGAKRKVLSAPDGAVHLPPAGPARPAPRHEGPSPGWGLSPQEAELIRNIQELLKRTIEQATGQIRWVTARAPRAPTPAPGRCPGETRPPDTARQAGRASGPGLVRVPGHGWPAGEAAQAGDSAGRGPGSAHRLNREHKESCEMSWSDKVEAYNIDEACSHLHSQSSAAQLHPHSALLEESASTPESWAKFTQEILSRAERERLASVNLRALIDCILRDTAEDLRLQSDAVNLAFGQRCEELEDSRHKLEHHLHKTLREITDQEHNVAALKQAIRDKEAPLKVAQTRLYQRSFRPNVELCRDTAQFRCGLGAALRAACAPAQRMSGAAWGRAQAHPLGRSGPFPPAAAAGSACDLGHREQGRLRARPPQAAGPLRTAPPGQGPPPGCREITPRARALASAGTPALGIPLPRPARETRTSLGAEGPERHGHSVSLWSRLASEVEELHASLAALKEQLLGAEQALRNLEDTRMSLEKDIAVRTNSLFVDRQKCLARRAHYPSVLQLAGYQ